MAKHLSRSTSTVLIAILREHSAEGLRINELVERLSSLEHDVDSPARWNIRYMPNVGGPPEARAAQFFAHVARQLDTLKAMNLVKRDGEQGPWSLVLPDYAELARNQTPQLASGRDADFDGPQESSGLGEVLAHPVIFCLTPQDLDAAIDLALGEGV